MPRPSPFELSDGAERIVVNCGGAALTGATIPADLARGLRTTAAHSTLVLADSNSTAILSNGSLGKGVTEVELDRRETPQGSRLEMSHDGYARRHGLIHRRLLILSPNGRELRGEDMLLPAPRTRRKGDKGFALRFHLGPSISASLTADKLGALLRINGGPLLAVPYLRRRARGRAKPVGRRRRPAAPDRTARRHRHRAGGRRQHRLDFQAYRLT